MNIFIILLLFLIGSVLSKANYIYILWNKNNKFREEYEKNPKIIQNSLIFYPFVSLINIKKSYVKQKWTFVLIEGIGMLSFLILGISLSYLYESGIYSNIEMFFHFIYFLIITGGILYLAIYDIIYLAIPEIVAVRLLFFSIIFQGIFALINFAFDLNSKLMLGNLANIAGFIAMYLAIIGLVIITKEDGIGKGDADIAGIIGLALGIEYSIVFIFLTFIIGGVIALIYSLFLGKLKGVVIPMVPLLLIGYTITIGFADKFSTLFFWNYL